MRSFCSVAVLENEEFQLCLVNEMKIFESLQQFFNDLHRVFTSKVLYLL